MSRSCLLIVLSLSTLFASAQRILAQSSPIPATWPPTARAALTQILDSAETERLPLSVLHLKIAEGIAKGASPAAILSVVRTLTRNLGIARTVLGSRSSEAALVAGSGALTAGLGSEGLRRLHSAISADRALTQALVVVTDLTYRGVDVDETVGALIRLSHAGAGDAAFAQLRVDVARDVANGIAARTAIGRRAAEYAVRGFTPGGGIFPPTLEP